jgi:FMN-dependent NADH-azoreductase
MVRAIQLSCNFTKKKIERMKVLHIDSSVRDGRSVSKKLSSFFIEQLKNNISPIQVDYLDLAQFTPRHPTALFIRANYTPEHERTQEMIAELQESETLVDRMHDAETYIIGMPMYNFSIPSVFKAFIDNIVRINRTFKMNGHDIEGLLKDKRAIVINTRGVDFNGGNMEHMDQLKPYLKAIFAFIGITDLSFIDVSPVQFSDTAAREHAIDKAMVEIVRAAKGFNLDQE